MYTDIGYGSGLPTGRGHTHPYMLTLVILANIL